MNEENKDIFDEQESTVFSAPPEHHDKPSNTIMKKRVLTVLALLAAVGVLVGGVFAAIKLIPEKEKKKSDIENTVTVVSLSESDLSSVILTENGTESRLYKVDGEKETEWYVEGIDEKFISTYRTRSFIEGITGIEGRKLNTEDDAAYGFDNPKYKIDVTAGDTAFTLLIGNQFTDGAYLKITGVNDGSYTVDSDTSSKLCKSVIDFSSTDSYTPSEFTTDVSAYKDSGGALISFDTLTISGSKYGNAITVVPNTDEITNADAPYRVTSPKAQYAANINFVMKLFTDSLTVNDGLSYTVNDQTIAQYGLDNPYIEVVLKVGSETKWYKMAKLDDENCAVLSSDFNMIRKVESKYITFYTLSYNDLLFRQLTPISASGVTELKAEGADFSYNFTVTTTNGKSVGALNGKTSQYFNDFYDTLTGASVSSFGDVNITSPDSTFTFKLSSGKTVTVKFQKGSGTKYDFTAEGYSGQITSSVYNKIIKALKQN